jgi:arylformamidase
MQILDISPLISADLDVWPGDTPYSREAVLDMQRGDHITLSHITASLHLGAHADAPNHYLKDGAGIAERDLSLYFGPCQVIEVDVPRGERVRLRHLQAALASGSNAVENVGAKKLAARVLFKTSTFPDPNNWNEDFAALSDELIDHLAEQGVQLVGIDTPSLDPQNERDLSAHHAVARHDMAVLECLVLTDIAPGPYTLCALPLKLDRADASPVRAVLLTDD